MKLFIFIFGAKLYSQIYSNIYIVYFPLYLKFTSSHEGIEEHNGEKKLQFRGASDDESGWSNRRRDLSVIVAEEREQDLSLMPM